MNTQHNTDCVHESSGFLRNVVLTCQTTWCHIPADSNHLIGLLLTKVWQAVRFLFQGFSPRFKQTREGTAFPTQSFK
jgi:hypothetical protein